MEEEKIMVGILMLLVYFYAKICSISLEDLCSKASAIPLVQSKEKSSVIMPKSQTLHCNSYFLVLVLLWVSIYNLQSKIGNFPITKYWVRKLWFNHVPSIYLPDFDKNLSLQSFLFLPLAVQSGRLNTPELLIVRSNSELCLQ